MKQLKGLAQNIDRLLIGKITFKNELFTNKKDLVFVTETDSIPSGHICVISSYNKNTTNKALVSNVKNTFELPFLYEDNILSIVHSTKVIDGITIHKTNRIGCNDTEYIAIKGDLSAHADSLKLALIDLRFKESDRDTSWLEDKTYDSILSFDDSVLAYRCITGACSGGVSHFLKSIKEKQEYKIGEIIDLTKNEYGNKEFTNFFI